MKSFLDEAKAYAAYHENPITRFAYRIGTPCIIFSLMIILGFVHIIIVGVLDFSLAFLATLALILYYFWLHWRLALALTPVLFVMLWFSNFFSSFNTLNTFSLGAFAAFFLVGCIALTLGYLLEKEKPRWTLSLWQIFIAPIFMTAELFFVTGHLRELNQLLRQKTKKTG